MLISVLNGTDIGDDSILEESMTLSESICSASALTIGSCEASTFKIQLRTEQELKGKTITVTNHDIQYGVFKVYEDKPTADRTFKEITAYDAMYDIINADVTEWYIGIFEQAETVTLKEFRDSFFNYLNIEQEVKTLPLDLWSISNCINKQQITGKDIIFAICEANACFGHIGRNGKFKYIYLNYSLVPRNDLFPAEDLYPGGRGLYEDMQENRYIDCKYSDFGTDLIDTVKVVNADGTEAITVGSNVPYVISDNFILFDRTASEYSYFARMFLVYAAEFIYRPFEANVVGMPELEVGKAIIIHTDTIDIESYVLERELSGVDALTDKFKARGQKSSERTASKIKNDIKNLKKEQVMQADRIEAEAARIGSLEADNVIIHGSLSAQDAEIGNLKAKDVEIEGSLSAQDARIGNIESDYINTAKLNAHTIDASKITSGTIDANRISANTFSGRVLACSGLNSGSVTCSTYNTSQATLTPVKVNIGGQWYWVLAAATNP